MLHPLSFRPPDPLIAIFEVERAAAKTDRAQPAVIRTHQVAQLPADQSTIHIVFGKTSHISKKDIYKWRLKDTPGELEMVSKYLINVDHSYQREASQHRINAMCANWSWIACGVIRVADRDGKFWAIDGQHRVLAALKRSDIDTLPCIIFKSASNVDEARAYLDANTSRRAPSSYQKYQAALVANDENVLFVHEIFKKHGISIVPHPHNPRELKCVNIAS